MQIERDAFDGKDWMELTSGLVFYNRKTPGGRALEFQKHVLNHIFHYPIVPDYIKSDGELDIDLVTADTCKEFVKLFPKHIRDRIRGSSKTPIWRILFDELRPQADALIDDLLLNYGLSGEYLNPLVARARTRSANQSVVQR